MEFIAYYIPFLYHYLKSFVQFWCCSRDTIPYFLSYYRRIVTKIRDAAGGSNYVHYHRKLSWYYPLFSVLLQKDCDMSRDAAGESNYIHYQQETLVMLSLISILLQKDCGMIRAAAGGSNYVHYQWKIGSIDKQLRSMCCVGYFCVCRQATNMFAPHGATCFNP